VRAARFAARALEQVGSERSVGALDDLDREPAHVDAARALAAAHPAGRMATWFDWGEYAIWHFGPAVKVSVDGRTSKVISRVPSNDAAFEKLARSFVEQMQWTPAKKDGGAIDGWTQMVIQPDR